MLLNPALYAILCQLYGEVRIVKPGDVGDPPVIRRNPATGKTYARWLDGSNHGEEYQCCCPFCGDQHFHLYVNHWYGKRDQCGSIVKLANCFKGCLDDRHEANRRRLFEQIMLESRRGIRPDTLRRIQATKAPTVVTACTRLEDVTPLSSLSSDHIAVKYLLDRGYTRENMTGYDLGYGGADTHFMARNRLVIPIYQNRIQVGWQGRRLLDGQGPKYYTSPGCPLGSVLYNYDTAKHQPFVVLTEGVTDVWRVGSPAVCLFGKALSGGQKTLVLNTWKSKPIIVMLDEDASEENERIREELVKYHNGPVKSVIVPRRYGDPGDTPPEVLRDLIVGVLDDK